MSSSYSSRDGYRRLREQARQGRLATLDEVRALANEGMGRAVPHYCLDLVGREGRLLKRDAELPGAGSFVDVVIVPRKVVCGECFDRLTCFCQAFCDDECSCKQETEILCSSCELVEEEDIFAGLTQW